MPLVLAPGPIWTRRRALAMLATGGVALATGCARRAGSNGHPAGWFALLSDPHVAADPSERLRGESLADNLRAVVAEILHAADPPHAVVVNGDLAFKTGQPGDYRTLLGLIEPLRRAGLPIHLGLGNHDDRANFLAASAKESASGEPALDRVVSTVAGPNVRFVVLDSQDGVNVTPGLLGDAQIGWLARDLDAHPGTPSVVVVHHNLNAHSESALRDTDGLLAVLLPRRQVKAVVFGHTHVWNVQKIDDLHAINLPAIGYRFLPKQPLGWAVLRPESDGAEIELRCIGGDRRKHGQRTWLKWRV